MFLHHRVQGVGRAQRRAVQPLRAGEVEIGFVDGGHFHLGRKAAQDFVSLVRVLSVSLRVSVDEERLWAELGRSAQRHGRMHTKLPGRVGSGGNNTALVALSTYDDRLALEGWVVELFHGDEERVHIDVEDGAVRGVDSRRGVGKFNHAKPVGEDLAKV